MINKELQKYMPIYCPACGEPLTFDDIHLMCNNPDCGGVIARKLGAAVNMLDLKNIGGKTIEPFAEDFNNMYELVRNMLQLIRTRCSFSMEKYGIKDNSRSFEIFVEAFENIKSLTYAQVILMMGYDGVGRKLSEQVAREYCGLVPDYTSMERALVSMLQEPSKVSYIKKAVSELEALGVIIDKPKDGDDPNGTIKVCMTGSPSPISKTKEEFILQFSNVIEVSLTDKNCNYLITDSLSSTSSKMKNAKKKNIDIITYEDFKNKFISE